MDGGRRSRPGAVCHADRSAAQRGTTTTLFYGARSATRAVLPRLVRSRGVRLVLTTEDGSRGERGRVTVPLERELAARGRRTSWSTPAGRKPMLEAVAHVAARYGRRCEVSVERVMGCGMGGCYSCVIPVSDKTGGQPLSCARASAGPVFEGAGSRVGLGQAHWHGPDRVSDRLAARWRTRSSRPAAASATASSTPTPWTFARSAAWSRRGCSSSRREGHPPERIVETPAGMLNAIGLQGIGVHRYIAREAAGAAPARRDQRRQHLRQHAGRVRGAGADPVRRRRRARARAEHLLPEHQGRRHHVRLQPARHVRRGQRRARR